MISPQQSSVWGRASMSVRVKIHETYIKKVKKGQKVKLTVDAYPAEVFMGDVGALGLGAALGTIAVIVRQELVLVVMGGIFVVETLSVMIQVASFKLTGKRVFRMAPIHHHFELKGWPEPRVIVRFWIISVILVLVGLATLKVR